MLTRSFYMKPYNGKWIDTFEVSVCEDTKRPSVKGKILLETPHCDYFLTKEQFNELKEKINKL